MAISSTGIGSGLDVNSIVTQLVAIEKQPLKNLQSTASKLQSQLSVYGTIKSQISALQDAATTLAADSNWTAQAATSSNSSAVTVSVGSTETSTELSVEVSQLAVAQTTASQSVVAGSKLGTGTGTGKLSIQLGNWGTLGTGPFVPGSTAAVSVDINESNTLAEVASAINAKSAGLKATVITSGGMDRLALQSTTGGLDSGFAVVSNGGFAVLDSLSFAPVTASQAIAAGSSLGSGSGTGVLTIQGGKRTTASGPFVSNGATPLSIPVNESDTLSSIASAINAASGSTVRATVVTTGGFDQLYLQPKDFANGTEFAVTADAALTSFFTPTFAPRVAFPSGGMESTQVGANAAAKINGVSVTSATNTLTDVVTGVTLNFLQKTTSGSPAQISVVQDKTTIQKNIQAFADAYTALSKTLSDATKYVPGGVSGVLQGDSTTVGLQSLLRRIVTSSTEGSTYSNLSKVGLQLQTDGSMTLKASSLTTAMSDMTKLQNLFTYVKDPLKVTYNSTTDGFGVKLREFTKGLLKADGTGNVVNKSTALEGAISRNTGDQDRVSTKAAMVEKRLRAQYSALDAKMGTLTSLSSYVTAQLAQWNKTSN